MPVIDDQEARNALYTCVFVLATNLLYLRSFEKRGTDSDDIPPQSVPIRFKTMGIDKVSDVQSSSILGVDDLKNYVPPRAKYKQYLILLTRKFAVASSLERSGSRRYE